MKKLAALVFALSVFAASPAWAVTYKITNEWDGLLQVFLSWDMLFIYLGIVNPGF